MEETGCSLQQLFPPKNLPSFRGCLKVMSSNKAVLLPNPGMNGNWLRLLPNKGNALCPCSEAKSAFFFVLCMLQNFQNGSSNARFCNMWKAMSPKTTRCSISWGSENLPLFEMLVASVAPSFTLPFTDAEKWGGTGFLGIPGDGREIWREQWSLQYIDNFSFCCCYYPQNIGGDRRDAISFVLPSKKVVKIYPSFCPSSVFSLWIVSPTATAIGKKEIGRHRRGRGCKSRSQGGIRLWVPESRPWSLPVVTSWHCHIVTGQHKEGNKSLWISHIDFHELASSVGASFSRRNKWAPLQYHSFQGGIYRGEKKLCSRLQFWAELTLLSSQGQYNSTFAKSSIINRG